MKNILDQAGGFYPEYPLYKYPVQSTKRKSSTVVQVEVNVVPKKARMENAIDATIKSNKIRQDRRNLKLIKAIMDNVLDSMDHETFTTEDFVMGESSCTLTLLDVADILQAKFAYISGGKTCEGFPIITFPDVPQTDEISDDQYQNVVNYLTSIPTLQEVDLGFVVIVDRRQCGWADIKSLLLKIAGFFPGLVHEVCVLRPAGFLARTFTDMGFKLVREDFKFKCPVLMYSSIEELHEHLPAAQLTTDLGGTLDYDHAEWTQQRAAIEKFSANTTQVGLTLRCLCKRLQDTEFPNDVESTEALILSHESERDEVKDDLRTTLRHGEILLGCFKGVKEDEGEDEEDCAIPSSSLPACKLTHVTAVERLLIQLEETERNFDDFWYHHEKRLQQCLQLRKFEEDFKQMQVRVSRQVDSLEGMSDPGDSITRVEVLLRELADFETTSGYFVGEGERIAGEGNQLIADEHYAVDCIRPKCLELQQMCATYRELVRSRYEVLHRSKDLQERIDKATRWVHEGERLLSSQDSEDSVSSIEEAESRISTLAVHEKAADELRLNNEREFRTMFENVLTPETKNRVQDVLKRVEETQKTISQHRSDLRAIVTHLTPPRPPEPAPLTPDVVARQDSHSPAPSVGDRRDSSSSESHSGRWKSKGGISEAIKLSKRSSCDKLSRLRVEIIRTDLPSDFSDSSCDDVDSTAGSVGCVGLLPPSLHHVQSAPDVLDNTSCPTRLITSDFDTLHTKRGHVMRELVDTERVYIAEISDIISGYIDQIQNPDMAQIVPEELKSKSKSHILFGNLVEIRDFHANTFAKDLENCRGTPASVGRCFVSRDQEFQIYSQYCQNKPNSECVRKEIGDSNPFFKECQSRLNHRLPLGAYLLKPIQRITKYQLLIKEMLKYTNDEESIRELKGALTTMLGVLKYVNDMMHQVAITHFPGNLSEQGKLLMQGPFTVWLKANNLKDLRFKPMQRHIFLYEKRILFCKKKEECLGGVEKSYVYKSSLDTADIGLTESVRGDKKKLELWLNGRAQIYTVQAASEAQKLTWVTEIKKVLMHQFDLLKSQKSHTAMVLGQLSITSANDNATNNNHPTVPSLGTLGQLGYSFSSLGTDDSVSAGSGSTAEHEYGEELSHGYSSDEYEESSHDCSQSCGSEQNMVFMALAEYNPVETGEIRLSKGDHLQVLQEGLEGWWYVRRISNKDEGWAPASYLDGAKRLSQLSTLSCSSNDSDMEQRGFINLRNTANRSSSNSAMSSESHGEETLV